MDSRSPQVVIMIGPDPGQVGGMASVVSQMLAMDLGGTFRHERPIGRASIAHSANLAKAIGGASISWDKTRLLLNDARKCRQSVTDAGDQSTKGDGVR